MAPLRSIGQQIADKLPEIVEAAAGAFKGVDNLTVLNGAQGISEIMNQIVGQAGPTLRLASRRSAPTRTARLQPALDAAADEARRLSWRPARSLGRVPRRRGAADRDL